MPSGRFRAKQVVIEAIQWDGSNFEEVGDWVWERVGHHPGEHSLLEHDGTGPKLFVITTEGKMEASPGDWIICGVENEFYPCKDSVFQKKYEEFREVIA
jgi:hypothetical protein